MQMSPTYRELQDNITKGKCKAQLTQHTVSQENTTKHVPSQDRESMIKRKAKNKDRKGTL